MKSTGLLLIFCSLAILVSCSQETSTTALSSSIGRVAVLDVQRVAKETGYTLKISRQLDELRNNLQTQLTGVQAQLNSQLNDKQIEFGKKPNKEQINELNKLFATAKLQLQNAQKQAVDVINNERSYLSSQLFDFLRPYAKRVANERGLDVVMLKSDLLLFDHDPNTDITNEVIDAVIKAKADVKLTLKNAAAASGSATAPSDKAVKNGDKSTEPQKAGDAEN